MPLEKLWQKIVEKLPRDPHKWEKFAETQYRTGHPQYRIRYGTYDLVLGWHLGGHGLQVYEGPRKVLLLCAPEISDLFAHLQAVEKEDLPSIAEKLLQAMG